jgi:hypothetical protein
LNEKQRAQHGQTLLERVEDLYARASTILEGAEQDGRHTVSLAAMRELRGIIELLGRLTGELDDRPQQVVNLLVAPEWLQIRAALLTALEAHPQAR